MVKGETFGMKLRVCFKDNYPCRAETCGEYDVCKVRLAKENYTNEEWFCQLQTEEKAEVIAQLSSYGGNVEAILEWLKEKHRKVT